MATNEYLPVYKPGQAITFVTSAAVSGGRLVEISAANTVRHAGAASDSVVGVAAWDAAVGQEVTVHSGGVQELVASAAIAAGDRVEAAADGKAATSTGAGFGVALTSASAANDLVRVKVSF